MHALPRRALVGPAAALVAAITALLLLAGTRWALGFLAVAWAGTVAALLQVLYRRRTHRPAVRRPAATAAAVAPTPVPAAPAAPAAPAVPAATEEPAEPTVWSREDLFTDFTPRALDEFVTASPPIAWATENPYAGRSPEELLDLVTAEVKWRYHHGVDAVPGTAEYYAAYATRVDAMLEMVDDALGRAGVDLPGSTFLDIGAAEGYVVNHLMERGAVEVDAIELNDVNIRRMWLVRALKGRTGGRIGRLDLDRVDWSRSLGQKYDVALALGVIYHMENPMLFARNLYALTSRVAVVESDTPVFPRNRRFRGHGTVYLHRDRVTLEEGNARYLTEMRPDRRALAEILLSVGFRSVEVIPAATGTPSRYFTAGEKSVLLAHV